MYKARKRKATSSPKKDVSVIDDPNNVSIISEDSKKVAGSLGSAMKAERRKSESFLKYLENVVQEGELELDNDQSIVYNSDFVRDNSFTGGNFTMSENQRRHSLDATGYFNRSQHDLSAIFDDTKDRSLLPTSGKRSDFGPVELSSLPGKKRRERLSEIFDNDPVMMYINEPTLTEDVENFKENLKASRRESDLFEKRLKHLLENHN